MQIEFNKPIKHETKSLSPNKKKNKNNLIMDSNFNQRPLRV